MRYSAARNSVGVPFIFPPVLRKFSYPVNYFSASAILFSTRISVLCRRERGQKGNKVLALHRFVVVTVQPLHIHAVFQVIKLKFSRNRNIQPVEYSQANQGRKESLSGF